MRAETSKQPENSSSQLSRRIAEGKRKRESYREELSLQDVFSESENSPGILQKTSRLSDTGQGKEAQLERKVNRKPSWSYKKLQQNLNCAMRLQSEKK